MLINKKRIYEYVSQHNSSVRQVEDQAGLARNAIHNILSDKSKNPALETICKIATILECSIDELLNIEIKAHNSSNTEEVKSYSPYNAALYNDVTNYVNNQLNKISHKKLYLNDMLYSIENIYEYSYSNNNKALDYKFGEWFLQNNIFKS